MHSELASWRTERAALHAAVERVAAAEAVPHPTLEDIARAVQREVVPLTRAEVIASVGAMHNGIQTSVRVYERDFCTRVWEKMQPVLRHSEVIIKFMDEIAAQQEDAGHPQLQP